MGKIMIFVKSKKNVGVKFFSNPIICSENKITYFGGTISGQNRFFFSPKIIQSFHICQVWFIIAFYPPLKTKLAGFLPMPLAVAWVNRWTFSSPPSPSHHQLFVFLRYRKCCGGEWVFCCDAILFKPCIRNNFFLFFFSQNFVRQFSILTVNILLYIFQLNQQFHAHTFFVFACGLFPPDVFNLIKLID